MEFLAKADGTRLPIPDEVVAEGRDAVQAYLVGAAAPVVPATPPQSTQPAPPAGEEP